MSAQNDKHAPLTSVKTNKAMTKYFEQKNAAELPEKSGEYQTDKGLLFFTKAGTAENINSYWMCAGDIEWWLLPVETKRMTLEEAKDKTAQKYGYSDFENAYWLENDHYIRIIINESADLYLSSNTAALREENDTKVKHWIESWNLRDKQASKAEQQVKTLKHENAKLLALLNQK